MLGLHLSRVDRGGVKLLVMAFTSGGSGSPTWPSRLISRYLLRADWGHISILGVFLGSVVRFAMTLVVESFIREKGSPLYAAPVIMSTSPAMFTA